MLQGLTILGKQQPGFLSIHVLPLPRGAVLCCPTPSSTRPDRGQTGRFPESQTLGAGSAKIRGIGKLHSPRALPSASLEMHVLGFFLKTFPVNSDFSSSNCCVSKMASAAISPSSHCLFLPPGRFSLLGKDPTP